MRNAPSVTYPVGRSVFQLWLLLGLGLAGALALLLWWWLSALPAGWMLGLGCAGWLVWGLAAFWSWRCAPVGWLQWDASPTTVPSLRCNGTWRWLPSEAGVPLELEAVLWMLDAQNVVLLRLRRAQGRALWVWLDGAREPATWDALRRALKAHAL